MTPPCPLCAASSDAFQTVDTQRYWRCPQCELTFLDAAHHLAPQPERAVYDQHDNRVDDPRYRAFLARLATPLLHRLDPGSDVLDYGCGPGPALAAMMDEAGHRSAVFDPFYAPDEHVLDDLYDAITCTEVAEHFHHPGDEFTRLASLLRPGGWLGVMTCLQTDDDAFPGWHYRRDPTHVCFYREHTLDWMAERYGWGLERPGKDVALFQAGGARTGGRDRA